MARLHWEDLTPGWVYESPPRTLTAEAIVEFAREHDPQRYHVDAAAAAQTPFGGLIASGWHTCCTLMRLMCDGYLNDSSCIGSPGFDGVRFLKPVRPGDAIRLRSTVLEQTPSAKVPTRGTVRWRWEMLNQRDEVVLEIVGLQHFTRRAPPS